MPSSPRTSAAAATEHQHAVQEFIAAARAVPDRDWERPLDHEKWSPAQVAEHLLLTYATVANEMAGGSGLRIRTPWLLRVMLRWRILPRILASGAIPEGAKAPREIRPGDGPFDRDQVLSALATSAKVAEEALVQHWSDGAGHMTHHVFGKLDAPTAMRFATVHARHHARQLAPRATT